MEKEWVVIFLIYADLFESDSDEIDINGERKVIRELQALYKDLINTPIHNDASIYSVINTIHFKENKKNDKTFIHKVKKRKELDLNYLQEIASIELDHTLQKADSLSAILSFINKVEPAKKIFLVTWDHGSVFGINKQIERQGFSEINFEISLDQILKGDEGDPARKRSNLFKFGNNIFRVNDTELEHFTSVVNNLNYDMLIKVENLQFSLKKEVGIISSESAPTDNKNIEPDKIPLLHPVETAFLLKRQAIIEAFHDPTPSFKIDLNLQSEILTNEELADAIKKGITKGKVDVLLMMNCNMMNIHTMNSLVGLVDFLVAPESDIDEPGYNYCAILSKLKKETDARQLALSCVDTFNASPTCGQISCKEHRDEHMHKNNAINLFAVELQKDKVDALTESINSFGASMIEKIKGDDRSSITEFRNSVRNTLGNCDLQSGRGLGYHLFDMEQWGSKYKVMLGRAHETIIPLISKDLEKLQQSIRDGKSIICLDHQPEPKQFCATAIFFSTEDVSAVTGVGPFIVSVKDNEKDKLSAWLGFLTHFFS
ncbi:MAG: clostripain-related cysteine peptidase [Chitinophagaceae bacterium]